MVRNTTPRPKTAPPQAGESACPLDDAGIRTIPAIEERLSVEAVSVDQEGYRITKQVRTVAEVVDELLHDSHIEIERRPMGTPLEGLDVPPQRQEGDTLVIPVVEEVLVTQKRLVLVEEVRVTRVHGTHRAPQSVNLRKEEISIQKLAPEPKAQQQPDSKPDREA